MVTSCCTTNVIHEIEEYSEPKNELPSNFQFESRIYSGSYLGEIEIEGDLFLQYQFKYILAESPRRVLQVLVAKKEKTLSKINEIDISETNIQIENAYLFSYYYITHDDKIAKNISRTSEYFRKYYGGINLKQYFPNIININLGTNHSSVYTLKYDRSSGFYYWCENESVNKIKWHSRSQTEVGLMRLKYLYSVPIDILTFPIQAIAIILHGMGY
jgi:hypothetical protein